MAVARLDPRLLLPAAGSIPLAGPVADLAGEPAVVCLDGDADDWGAVAARPEHERVAMAQFLGQVPALTIALARGQASPGLDTVAAGCDLRAFAGDRPGGDGPYNLVGDEATVARRVSDWCEGAAAALRACVVSALLVRRPPLSTWTGLVAESLAYSVLQAGPDFAAWLAEQSEARRPVVATESAVRVERSAGVTEVILARPDRHNALDVAMRDRLYEAMEELRHTEEPIVVRGDGPSFCSGGDLAEFGTSPGPVDAHLVRLGRSLALLFAEVGHRMVVAVHGVAAGAGIELAAFAGHVLAAPNTLISLPEARLGLLPGAGGTVSIPRRAGGHRLVELVVTGEAVGADTACRWGLVDEVVEEGSVADRARQVARS